MEAKALSLWFQGTATNDANEEMYITLVDNDTPMHTATVGYKDYGDMNDLRKAVWKEWNIPLADFTADNPSLKLGKVKNIIIGFGDGEPAAFKDGTAYFEDIRVYATRCALLERNPDIALVDFAPGGTGDCVVDNYEIEVMANDWLASDDVIPTKDPCDVNLVLYYPLDEGDGNKIYATKGSGGRAGDLDLWTGTIYNRSTTPPSNRGVSWSEDHAPGIGGTACLYINGDYSSVVSCGTYGQCGLGIGNTPPDTNKMTLSVWAKWMGPRAWDPYLLEKSQGFLGKRGGWSDIAMVWMLECLPGAAPPISFRHFATTGEPRPDLTSAAGRMLTELNRWSHYAVTFDGNMGTLYINGGQVISARTRISNGPDPNIFLTIGNTMDINAWPGNGSPEAFYGYLDEVRIYDRALEPNEVAYLADSSPEDGFVQIPVPSSAEVYAKEPVGQQMVNFKDFALVMKQWLEEDMFP
jgi:hypothetical protein